MAGTRYKVLRGRYAQQYGRLLDVKPKERKIRLELDSGEKVWFAAQDVTVVR